MLMKSTPERRPEQGREEEVLTRMLQNNWKVKKLFDSFILITFASNQDHPIIQRENANMFPLSN